MNFEELNLAPAIVKAVLEQGYETPTAIQAQAIPVILEGHDLLGGAQTGTGKTAAFVLPILHKLSQGQTSKNKFGGLGIRALVLTPTRELAAQVEESVQTYGKYLEMSSTVIFGGVGMNPQISRVKKGVDVLVATPGRLLDLLQQGVLDLGQVEILVLDEADRMLDMGFIHDIRKVVAMLPGDRQNLFFSATMPPDISKLAGTILRSPVRVEVVPASTPIERIDQLLYRVDKKGKQILLRVLMQDPTITRALVFSRTKHGANRIAEHLMKAGVRSAAIHGNKSQTRRQEALSDFKSGAIRVLVATDIAARGIDVDAVSHVFNFDLPEVPETYVHRIGRTARAGASGKAIAFCAPDETDELKQIERLTRIRIPEADPAPLLANAGPEPVGYSLVDERPERPQRPFQGRKPERSRSATTGHKGRAPQQQQQQQQTPGIRDASAESVDRNRRRRQPRRNGNGNSNNNSGNSFGGGASNNGGNNQRSAPDGQNGLLSKLGQGIGKLFGR